MTTMGHNLGDIDEADTTNSFFVSREVFEHDMFQAKPWCDGFAWLHLLSMASDETKRKLNKGTVVILDPGDLMAAHDWLAKKWGWSVDKVRYFLKRLEREAMITRFCAKQDNNRRTNQIQIITICNYSRYQLVREAQHQAIHEATHQANTKPTPSAHQANTRNIDTYLDLPSNSYTPLPPKGGDEPSVIFSAGKLTVVNGTAASLVAEFPGIDLQAVCNRAAKDVIQLASPTPDAMLAVIRSFAQAEVETQAKRERRANAERGTRIPDDWRLPKALGEWAVAKHGMTAEEVRAEAEIFHDFWKAKAGPQAKKLDWAATWRGWIDRKNQRKATFVPRKTAEPVSATGLNYDWVLNRYGSRTEGGE
jgi:hypothetical protein